jgi:acyl-CoA dehydrogenase
MPDQSNASHAAPAVDHATFDEMLEALRRFVWTSLVALEREVEESGLVPEEVVEQMRELGIFGLSIAPEYGGIGLTPTQEARAYMVLSETSQGFRYPYGTNVGIGSRAISLDGTPEQKATYLPRLASGELISAFCATEPDAGSDLASLKSRALRDGDYYVLSGAKRFITNADVAGVFTALARTGAPDSGAKGVSAFIVERDTPGLSIGKPEKKLGQRGGAICDVIFDGVRVHASQIIGGVEGRGFATAMRTLDAGRIGVAANCIGQMRRAIDEAARYALERRQFGQPIADFQLVQALLADSETDWFAARLTVLEAARVLEQRQSASREAACAKYFASEALGRVADRCLQVLGGSGYIAEYPLERIYRDARVSRIYEGTSQIMQLVIAKDLLRSYG